MSYPAPIVAATQGSHLSFYHAFITPLVDIVIGVVVTDGSDRFAGTRSWVSPDDEPHGTAEQH